MSTYQYFKCLDHDPALVSAGEFSQHYGDEYYKHGIELALNRPVDPPAGGPKTGTGWFEDNARMFLSQHPTCRIVIVDEYAVHQPLEDEGIKALSIKAAILAQEAAALEGELHDKRTQLRELMVQIEQLKLEK